MNSLKIIRRRGGEGVHTIESHVIAKIDGFLQLRPVEVGHTDIVNLADSHKIVEG